MNANSSLSHFSPILLLGDHLTHLKHLHVILPINQLSGNTSPIAQTTYNYCNVNNNDIKNFFKAGYFYYPGHSQGWQTVQLDQQVGKWNHDDFIDDDHGGHNHDNGLADCTKRSSQSNKVLMGKWSFSGKWLSSLIYCRDAIHMRGGCHKPQVNFRRRFSKLLNTLRLDLTAIQLLPLLVKLFL